MFVQLVCVVCLGLALTSSLLPSVQAKKEVAENGNADEQTTRVRRYKGCPPFTEENAFGCACRRPVLDTNGTVYHQGFFTLDTKGVPFLRSDTCHACPKGGTCMGGRKKPIPQPGFWTNAECPIAFAACEANLDFGRPLLCQAPDEKDVYGKCKEGHEGILCHKCKDGYGRDNPNSPFCVKCKGMDGGGEGDADGGGGALKTKLWHVLFLGGNALYLSGMSLSLIFTGLEADKRNKPEMSQLLKALLSYLGSTKLLLSGNMRGWPESLQLFISTNKPPKATSTVTSFDCWMSNGSENKAVFSYALTILPELCSVVICALYLFFHSYSLTKKYVALKESDKLEKSIDGLGMSKFITKEEESVTFPKLLLLVDDCGSTLGPKKSDLRLLGCIREYVRKLLPRVAIVCSTSMWPSFLTWALGFLACGSYPRNFITSCDESSYVEMMNQKILLWEYDKGLQCFTGLHSKMLEYSLLPLLVVITFPAFVLFFLKRNCQKMYVDDQFDYTYGFLYRDYERKYFYWEAVIQMRTFALTALVIYCGTALELQDLQLLLLLVVIFMSVLLHIIFLPYDSDSVDLAHQCVLVNSAVIIIASMFFKLDIQSAYWEHFREM